MNKIIDIILKNIEDFFILAGILLINIATYVLNSIAGLYCTGAFFILIGLYFAKYPIKKGR